MKTKLFSITLLGILFVVLSGLTAMSPPSDKIVIKTNTVEPFSQIFVNPANSDFILFTGNVHSSHKVTMWPDGKIHNKYHTNYQGVSGVGIPSGDTYHMISVLNSHYNSNVGVTESFHQKLHIVHNGGENFDVYIHTHMTTNANGEVTSNWTKD